MTLWLTVRTPDGNFCWQVDDDPDVRENQVDRARALVGFPPGEEWLRQPDSGWHLMLSPADPHPALGARERDVAELANVASADVTAWRDADVAANRQRRISRVSAALESLDPEERAEVIAQHHIPSRARKEAQ